MKVCEICGAEEKLHEEREAEESVLGVCEECMQDFVQK